MMTDTTNSPRLFFIGYSDEMGESLDQFVWAHDPQQALQLWFAFWEFDERPGARLFEVPIERPTQPTVLRWHEDIKQLAEPAW